MLWVLWVTDSASTVGTVGTVRDFAFEDEQLGALRVNFQEVDLPVIRTA